MRWVALAATFLLATPAATAAPPPSPDAHTVRFATRILSGSAQVLPLVFDAVYDAPEGKAHFRITLAHQLVTLTALRGSKPGPMLAALERALDAKRVPAHAKRVKQLQVAVIILDYKAATGWALTKLMFGNNDVGEVYLGLNLKKGLGEFTLEDPRYGDAVLAQLARVL